MEDILKNEEDCALTNTEARQHWVKNQTFILRYTARDDTTSIFDKCLMPYVARRQLSKNCFLIAVGTLLGYKFTLDNYELLLQLDEALTAHSIDLSKLIRHHFRDEQLDKRVLQNGGGCSTETLNDLISHVPGLKTMNISIDDDEDDVEGPRIIKKALREGPVLVPQFRTDDFLRQARKLYYPLGSIPQFDIDPVTGKDVVRTLSLTKPIENEKCTLNIFAQAQRIQDIGR
jgi:hypothetical protein